MEASKEEQRGGIRFLLAEGAGTCEIHRHMSAAYGAHCLSLTSVHEWQKRFREGCTSLLDDSRPGEAHRAITPNVIVRTNGLNRENRRIIEEQIRVQFGISHGSMHAIINDHLQFRKIWVQWVLHQRTEEQTIDKLAACPSHFQQYHQEDYAFLSHVVTGDETRFHHFEPESKW